MISDAHANKVLCLHGFRQSGNEMKSNTKLLREQILKIEPYLEFIYPNGPHQIQKAFYSWLYFNESKKYSFTKHMQQSDLFVYGWNDSLSFLKVYLHTKLRCTILTLFLGYFSNQNLNIFPNLDKIILFSGLNRPKPSNEDLSFFILMETSTANKIAIPSLHITGLSDQAIVDQRSQTLELVYLNGSKYEHEGGHEIPQSKQVVDAVLRFLSRKANL